MSMPAPTCVTFRGDQHMLAESGEQMTTDRTLIRRRLAVRRPAHRPPWRGWKSGHRTIVAPVAATLAATLAVGVGVALAKAGRGRRTGVENGHERDFALAPGERLGEGLRRIALGQVELAIELLGGQDGGFDEHAVHETRKALKRLRALLRLLRGELGEEAFARENAALRDVGALLAGARDSEVMLATLDALIARHPGKLSSRGAVSKLRARLAREHEHMEQRTLGREATRAAALAELHDFRTRALEWHHAEHDGSALIEPGLHRIYTQGRARYRRAAHARGDRVHAMHEWRKRVKDLRYAAEMLQRSESQAAGARRPRRKKDRRGEARDADRLRRLARRADLLGETLGEDHDLALLAALLNTAETSAGSTGQRMKPRSRKLLLKLIKRRRRALRKRALRVGEELYGPSPKRFLAGVRSDYASGSRSFS